MSVHATTGNTSLQQVIAGQNINLTAPGSVFYDEVQATNDVRVTSGTGQIALTKKLIAGNDLHVDLGNTDVSVNSDTFIAGNTFFLTANDLDLSNRTSTFNAASFDLSGNLDLTDGQFIASTQTTGSGNLTIAADTILTSASSILAAHNNLSLDLQNLTNSGEVIALNDLDANIAGNLTNKGTGLVFASGDARLFATNTVRNEGGTIIAGRNLAIGQGISNTTVQHNSEVRNISGLIQSGGDLSIATNAFINERENAEIVSQNTGPTERYFIADQQMLDSWWTSQDDILIHEDGYLYSASGDFSFTDTLNVLNLNIRGTDLISAAAITDLPATADVAVTDQLIFDQPSKTAAAYFAERVGVRYSCHESDGGGSCSYFRVIDGQVYSHRIPNWGGGPPPVGSILLGYTEYAFDFNASRSPSSVTTNIIR